MNLKICTYTGFRRCPFGQVRVPDEVYKCPFRASVRPWSEANDDGSIRTSLSEQISSGRKTRMSVAEIQARFRYLLAQVHEVSNPSIQRAILEAPGIQIPPKFCVVMAWHLFSYRYNPDRYSGFEIITKVKRVLQAKALRSLRKRAFFSARTTNTEYLRKISKKLARCKQRPYKTKKVNDA